MCNAWSRITLRIRTLPLIVSTCVASLIRCLIFALQTMTCASYHLPAQTLDGPTDTGGGTGGQVQVYMVQVLTNL